MELLERRPQLDALKQGLRETMDGAGKVFFLAGEAGVGKTSLVEQFVAHPADGVRVLWGNCDALRTPRVLGPVHEIAALLPSLKALNGEPSRGRLFTGLLQEVCRQPVSVIVLEDIHWADEATLDFVIYLGRRIQRTRCLFIATFRDDEISAAHPLHRALGELTGRHVARLRLPTLSPDAVAHLAAASGKDPSRLYAITAGNPFFVQELLAVVDTKSVPETVRDAVLARLNRCGEKARTVAEFVSASPGKTEYWLLASIVGDVVAGIDETIERGLIHYQEGSIAFRHELARLAVESNLPAARAREMHNQILRVLKEHDADLSRLVHHAGHAADIPAILEYAPRAGLEAEKLNAHREAVAHYAAAVRHAHHLPTPRRAELLESHARECNLTNQVDAAIESARQAQALWRELANAKAEARALRILSRQHWAGGNKAEADRYVSDAIALLERLPDGVDLARAYSARSQLAMLEGRVKRAVALARQALELAVKLGDAETESHALNNIGSALLGSGDESGYAQLERSLAIALEHDLPEHAGRAYSNLTTCSVLRHDFARAERFLEEGTRYCEDHEIYTHLAYLRAYRARFEFERGHWTEAANDATALLRNVQLTAVQRIPTLITLGLVRVRRGDPGADSLFDEALELALPTQELQRIGRVAAARAEYAWYRGDADGVMRETAMALNIAEGHRDPWIKGELLFWKSRVEGALPAPVDIAEPYRLMILGKASLAADAWGEIGMPYERALALSLGPATALRESLELLDALEARPLAGMVRRRLRELGVRGVRRGPHTSTRRNPAGLTAREIEVLRLLVDGHTDAELARRLHISVKTVGHHVSSILAKLGVRSRTEAATAALRLGIASGDDS